MLRLLKSTFTLSSFSIFLMVGGCALNLVDEESSMLDSYAETGLQESSSDTGNGAKNLDGSKKSSGLSETKLLPKKYLCRNTIRIHASQITDEQLQDICLEIGDTEAYFHGLLSTHYQPVDGDLNDSLDLYIFDGYKHYIDNVGKISGLSNNPKGGYFFEGNPFDGDKQPAAYLFVSSQSTFSVWNLKHEFTHYLNARFVKYGHVKDSALFLFWEEGLAEYIAKKTENRQAIALARKEKTKTLEDIFDVTYRDSSDEVYLWSYLGIRYLIERQMGVINQIVQALRNDDEATFKSVMNTTAANQEADFQKWLKSL